MSVLSSSLITSSIERATIWFGTMHQSHFFLHDANEGYTEESPRRSLGCAYPPYQLPQSASGGVENVPERWDTQLEAHITNEHPWTVTQPRSPDGEIGSSGLPNLFGPPPPPSFFYRSTSHLPWMHWEALDSRKGSDDSLALQNPIDTLNSVLPGPVIGRDAKSLVASADTCGISSPHACTAPRIIKRVVASESVVGASARRRLPTNAEDLFHCTVPSCTSTFTTRYNLNNHIKSHLGAKEHKCNYCSYEAVTKSDIRRHTKTCKFRTAGSGSGNVPSHLQVR